MTASDPAPANDPAASDTSAADPRHKREPGKASKADKTSGTAETKPPAYEQARDELAELVKRLEAGGLTLEQSLQLWERGEQLAAICEEWLEGARARLATAMARQHSDPAPGAPF